MGQPISPDLYLAFACLHGTPNAANQLVEHTRPSLRRALERLQAAPDAIDEAIQKVYEAVLVKARPQLRTYSGRGSLENWVRAIGVRTCRRLLGAENKASGAGVLDLESLAIEKADAELLHFKQHYAEQFRLAFAEAANTLTERQRNLLRQQYIDGLTIDGLAALYGVHRATSARWIAQARQTLLDETRRLLTDLLGTSVEDVDSIIRMVRSQIDISIRTILG